MQNTLLFLCIAVALLTVSSMLIHHLKLPAVLDETLTEESLHFLYIAGVGGLFSLFFFSAHCRHA